MTGRHDFGFMLTPISTQRLSPRNAGFAIVVVLASLIVLTAVFAISSQRSIAHIQTSRADKHLAVRQAENAAVLTILSSMDLAQLGSDNISLPEPYDHVALRLQDVGGLIDLNTASPLLLARFFDAHAFPPNAQQRFLAWRRDGYRLQRVDDLLRIVEADQSLLPMLLQVATVHSGRQGISSEHAPLLVLQITGADHETAPSLVNFAVYREDGAATRMIGVIGASRPGSKGSVLDLR